MTIRIALIDDQSLFRSGVKVVLDAQDDMEVVGEASDGREGLELIRATAPDVVLLDMRMPGMDGVATTAELFGPTWDGPLPRVIVLTTFALDQAAASAVRRGASGFLLKDATPAFLCASIRAVHSGSSVIAPNELTQLLSPTVEQAPAPPAPEGYRQLTERELVIFGLAARGLSNAEIAEVEFVSESTVKSQVSAVLSKLKLRDRVQLVVFAHDYRLI